MIGLIRGQLIACYKSIVLLETASGVGYEIEVPMNLINNLPAYGTEICFYTHMAVRETEHMLYGFQSILDRSVFRTLIKINGVGPKMALAILSVIPVTKLLEIAHVGDTNELLIIPGIGKKTANRLIIEMKERLAQYEMTIQNTVFAIDKNLTNIQSNSNIVIEEAEAALVSLGYKVAQAKSMIKNAYELEMDTHTLIKKALQQSV